MSTSSLLLLFLVLLNGLLSTEGQSSGDQEFDEVQSRLMKLEQAMAKLQSENALIKEELRKAMQPVIEPNNSLLIKQLENNLTLLQDFVKELEGNNILSHHKILVLQDELWTSMNETSELRNLVTLLHKKLMATTTQFVDTKNNVTLMQQSIKQLMKNITILVNKSSNDGDKLVELIQLVSTLQPLIITMENRQLQFESLMSASNNLTRNRVNELEQKLDVSSDQLVKRNRKQDRQLKKVIAQVNAMQQQVDELLMNDTAVIATTCTNLCHNGGSCGSDGVCRCTVDWSGPNCSERVYPRSCEEQYSLHPQSSSGVYQLQLSSSGPTTSVYCQLVTEHSSLPPKLWTVVQRRSNGSVNFTRPWNDYVKGFGGDPTGDYWMGLEHMHMLTTKGCKLMVTMEDYNGNKARTVYASITVRSSMFNYELGITVNWTGTAGDSLSAANGVGFSTYDRDHDEHYLSCAKLHGGGGWWYTNCGLSRLNGQFASTPRRDDVHLTWHSWKRSDDSLKRCSMLISCNN